MDVAVTIALPTADRRVAFDFCSTGLGLVAVGPPGDDGLPEPLQFVLGADTRLMLIPRGGFGWVSADHDVAGPGQSECILTLLVATPAEVDAATDRARGAGATVKVEPSDPGWGYGSTFTDPDGHLWSVRVG